jgi:hypothetical protein
MQSNWAAENLQVIRTLMERSALYRRALAPISTFLGMLGIVASVIGWKMNIQSIEAFAIYWLAVGFVGVVGALILVRRQALKHAEKFWSPPTRRIAQAISPALTIGLVFGIIAALKFRGTDHSVIFALVIIWTLLYGLALHAAGFFVQRGIRLFGTSFLLAGMIFFGFVIRRDVLEQGLSPHWLMGGIFGGLHLAYGIYLYFTEKGKNAA